MRCAALQKEDTMSINPSDPDFITLKTACAIIGGDKPISLPTFYRDPLFKGLIEHEIDLHILSLIARRDASNGSGR